MFQKLKQPLTITLTLGLAPFMALGTTIGMCGLFALLGIYVFFGGK